VNPNKKLIAFTFDDAPSKTLEQIVAVFATFNETHPDAPASATVFCNGKRIDSHNLPLLHGACALGFEMGNHGYSHSDITTLTSEKLQTEIAKTDELLSVVDGKKTHLFRAPYGHINERVKKEIGVPIVDWTIDTLDWTNTSAKAIYSTIWEGRFSGAIALMHDGYPHTVDALKGLLPALYEDGYQVVSVSQMAKAHDCALRAGGVYIRARKH
jgi:peptidoglycan/xylan/chitin deacetylase (PgdA/CDA1 family)